MNWDPTSRQCFRSLRKQGEGLTIAGGCLYSSTGRAIGTYIVWRLGGQLFLKHEAYYSGEERYYSKEMKHAKNNVDSSRGLYRFDRDQQRS